MTQPTQTEDTETIAFRTATWRKHEIAAAAARRKESPSDWLRRAVELALAEEQLARVQPSGGWWEEAT